MFDDDFYWCVVCRQDTYHMPDRSMMIYMEKVAGNALASDVSNAMAVNSNEPPLCSHRLCSVCYARLFQKRSTAACPQCRQILNQSNFSENDTDRNYLTLEKIARGRVMSVYNKVRQEFPNTPLYNDYVEQREDRILEFLNAPPEKRRLLEAELREVGDNNNSAIIDSSTRREEMLKQRVREIVQREDTFYEQVKLNPHEYAKGTKLRHPFRTQYINLFDDQSASDTELEASKKSKLKPQAMTAYPKEVRPLPLKLDRTNASEYNKLLQRRWEAGGYDMKVREERLRSELFFGHGAVF